MTIRVLFVGRSIAHLSYYETVISALMVRGAEVELALDEKWSKNWAGGTTALSEFRQRHPALKTSWIVRRKDEHRDRIFALRELASYRSYLKRRHTTPYYIERWRTYLTPEYREKSEDPKFRRWLKSPLTGLWLRREEARTPPDPAIVDFIRSRSPDVLVASPVDMRFSEETDYVKAAKALNIPTAIPVLSWDNLSTKGLIHILPDRLFVWNANQRQDALEIHKAPPNRVEVAGSPFFDKWFDKGDPGISRDAFCAKAGLDSAAPILLYLGSSKNIARDESWFVLALRDALLASQDPAVRRYQLLVRPHPANAEIYKALSEQALPVFPKDGALPETRESFDDLRASVAHAAAAIGINTSGMIDTVMADKPTFTVRLDDYAATQSDSVHFSYLVKGDALYLSDNLTDFVEGLSRLASGEDPKAAARRRFVQDFARPQGLERSAGDVVAEGVLKMARRR